MGNRFSVIAPLEKIPTEGGWHIVRLHADILESLRTSANKNGNVPIRVTVGATTWPTTIMSMGEGRWFFAVSASVRKAENLQEGDQIRAVVEPDWEKLKQT